MVSIPHCTSFHTPVSHAFLALVAGHTSSHASMAVRLSCLLHSCSPLIPQECCQSFHSFFDCTRPIHHCHSISRPDHSFHSITSVADSTHFNLALSTYFAQAFMFLISPFYHSTTVNIPSSGSACNLSTTTRIRIPPFHLPHSTLSPLAFHHFTSRIPPFHLIYPKPFWQKEAPLTFWPARDVALMAMDDDRPGQRSRSSSFAPMLRG